jgi:stearoyl-CoA desaturase (Delta-9 desaturase)
VDHSIQQSGLLNPAQPQGAELPPYRIPVHIKILDLGAIIVPFLGLVLAIYLVWGWGLSWTHLGLMLGMYTVSILGVTVGFHRLFTHKAFETNRVVKCIVTICGSMAVEGPVIKWVAMHRRHHQFSDRDGDPHSPHLHGLGMREWFKGIWHAHMGWLLKPDAPDLARYVRDLVSDRMLRALDRTFTLWVAVGLLLPAGLGALITQSWTGALLGFIWGGLVRIFLVHHVTFSINSICHIWGSRPFRSHDHSTNNFLFAILGFGEGWHNNHHAFPTSARHGLKWWQIDVTYIIIRLMGAVGLAWNIRVPDARAIAAKLRG